MRFVCLVAEQTPCQAAPSDVRVPGASECVVREATRTKHSDGAAGPSLGRMSQTLDAAAATAFTAIPEVDLRRWHGRRRRPRRARRARSAQICHEVGFFQLVGHGVPAGFRARYFDLLQAFFALPEDVKAEIDKVRSPHFRGWERVGAELTDNRTDFREQLDVSTENPPYPPTRCRRTCASTAPTSGCPTTSCPASTAPSTELFERLGAVAFELMEVLSVGLGLAPGPPPRRVRRAPAVARQADQLPADAARRGRRQRPPRRRVPDAADAARRRRPAGRRTPTATGSTCRRATTRSSSTSARCCSG